MSKADPARAAKASGPREPDALCLSLEEAFAVLDLCLLSQIELTGSGESALVKLALFCAHSLEAKGKRAKNGGHLSRHSGPRISVRHSASLP